MLLLMAYINPANRLMVIDIPIYLIGFYTSQVVGLGISEPSTAWLQFWWRFGFYNFEKPRLFRVGCCKFPSFGWSNLIDPWMFLLQRFESVRLTACHEKGSNQAGRLFRGPKVLQFQQNWVWFGGIALSPGCRLLCPSRSFLGIPRSRCVNNTQHVFGWLLLSHWVDWDVSFCQFCLVLFPQSTLWILEMMLVSSETSKKLD